MFKKSLAAVALLGAFAGSAFAADVTLYGVVDEGFLYTHKDADKTGVDAVDKLELNLPLFLIPELRAVSGNLRQPEVKCFAYK